MPNYVVEVRFIAYHRLCVRADNMEQLRNYIELVPREALPAEHTTECEIDLDDAYVDEEWPADADLAELMRTAGIPVEEEADDV